MGSGVGLSRVQLADIHSLQHCVVLALLYIDEPVPMPFISPATTGSDYQLITTTSCRKHGTIHCHLSLVNQLLTQLIQAT